MRGIKVLFAIVVMHAIQPLNDWAAEPPEPFLKNLPAGLFLQSSTLAPAAQTEAIARRLGGEVDRLTNSKLRVQGRSIQLNAITAATDEDAERIHVVIGRNKPYPFCFQRDNLVIEYVGQSVDEALALKTSFELGLIKKPASVSFQITAKLATVDSVDYMTCNPLFQQFVRLDQGDDSAKAEIEKLSKQLSFADSLQLRNPSHFPSRAKFAFTPRPNAQSSEDGSYQFSSLPSRLGIPYVEVTLQVPAFPDGLYKDSKKPGPHLTDATKRWPADNEELQTLARQITEGKESIDEKVRAILQWLTPGTHLRYQGQTGSRWGTLQAIKQGYGHCWDFSDCFVTLARAADVPTRQVAGWLYGSSGHVWAEYFRDGIGWQQVDPTGGGKLDCGIYHIPYFTTEDGEMPIVYLGMPSVEMVLDEVSK